MWFSLFAVVLILAITFYQGLLGVFTAAINFFLAVLAAGLAFGLYEYVFFEYLLERQPDDGRGIALMGIFIIALLLMRVIVDLAIKENMHFPVVADRVGGGIFGFLTAMIIIGVLAIGIQSLPFDHQWLGFSRYAMFDGDSGQEVALVPKDEREKEADLLAALDLKKVNFVRQSLWFNPDGFTLGLISHLSDNALAGRNRFKAVHDDLLDELFWARFTQKGQKTMLARKADAVKVEVCWVLPEEDVWIATAPSDRKDPTLTLSEPSRNDEKLEPGHRYLALRVNAGKDATDDGTTFRFTTEQVRLLTKEAGGRTGSYSLAAVNAPNLAHPKSRLKDLYYRLTRGESVERHLGNFDLVFAVPQDAEPWLLKFRSNALAEVREVAAEPPLSIAAPPEATEGRSRRTDRGTSGDDQASGGTGSSRQGRANRNLNRHEGGSRDAEARRGGRTNRVSSDLEGSFFSNELPFQLTQYSETGIEIQGNKVIGGGGRLIARFEEGLTPVQGDQPALREFEVPADKRLLQLSTTRLHPGSTYGQAISFASQIKNVAVFDENNEEYRAIGMWAVATVGSERLFELVYFDQTTRLSGSAVPQPERIRRENMERDYLFYYLFEIPPGKKIVRFLAGRGNGEDLTPADLVAPN